MLFLSSLFSFFFFNDTATTEIYTLSLHDALPISTPAPNEVLVRVHGSSVNPVDNGIAAGMLRQMGVEYEFPRSEEHTSELQSHVNLVCRLLLEKKKKKKNKRCIH